ncbi:hypothetical protein [Dickeya zeae]|uniref:hypothetical protein n=1 Tax=Dickeya zeae TaxID=204042 RepID=UPI001C625DD1|nr:hypothetical protein [Dickeya zeae]MCO7263939.1 hypothetical protein [Dickeya zeae]
MTRIYVQFSDESKTKIISVFASPQQNSENMAEISVTDERYQEYVKNIYDPFNLMNSFG